MGYIWEFGINLKSIIQSWKLIGPLFPGNSINIFIQVFEIEKKKIFFNFWHRFIGVASYKSMWFVRLYTILYYSYGMKLQPFQKHFLEDHNRCTPDGFYHCYAEREVQVHF